MENVSRDEFLRARRKINEQNTSIEEHAGDIGNPHNVTKAQVGLGNVTNNAQVRKIASSTNGRIMEWNGTGGDTPKVAPVPSASLVKCVKRKNNTTNNTVTNQEIQSGWGYVTGDSAHSYVTDAVTFPVSYDAGTVPLVFCNFLGTKSTSAGAPSSPADFSNAPFYSIGIDPSNTGFTADVHCRDSSDLSSSTNYGYAWLAIGTKTR